MFNSIVQTSYHAHLPQLMLFFPGQNINLQKLEWVYTLQKRCEWMSFQTNVVEKFIYFSNSTQTVKLLY